MTIKRSKAPHRTRGTGDGYYIFRAWKIDPKTGERMPPPDGKKAWRIWIPNKGPTPPSQAEQ